MLKAVDAVRVNDSAIVIDALTQFQICIKELGKILKRMNERCDPTVFYTEIRPFLAGSKHMAAAGLPNGVFYEEGNGKGKWRQYNGGSNAQSSLIQFFDVILGVQHSLTKGSNGPKNGFLKVCPLLSLLPVLKSINSFSRECKITCQAPIARFFNTSNP